MILQRLTLILIVEVMVITKEGLYAQINIIIHIWEIIPVAVIHNLPTKIHMRINRRIMDMGTTTSKPTPGEEVTEI